MNTEKTIEYNLIKRLIGLNYTYREDIHDKYGAQNETYKTN